MADGKLEHPWSADRPITTRTEDLLGRGDFASSLAKSIAGWTQRDSLVIALYGPWGVGKSSVKNLVLEQLRATKPIPLIVEFSPWQWAAQDQVAKAFFDEIGTAIGRKDASKESKQLAAKWRAYAAYLKLGTTTLMGLRNLIAGLLLAFSLLGFGVGAVPDGFRVIAIAAAVVGLVAAAIFKFGGEVGEGLAKALSEGPLEDQGLVETKKQLSDELSNLKQPILIVMDDIDRLNAAEVRLLFQLVKVNADFPNLVYLLLCARGAVETALQHEIPGLSGREFLEKIVQVGFDVPRLDTSRVHKILFTGLDAELERLQVAQKFDQVRWGNIFVAGLGPYFRNLRDVRRFLATFSFNAQRLGSGTSFEVNPVDLIAIEVLRVFEPDLYQSLPDAKSLLTQLGSLTDRSDHAKGAATDLVDKVPVEKRPRAREILRQLFPPIEWAFEGTQYADSFRPEWYRNLRVCHPDVFDRYFHLAIAASEVSQAEINRIVVNSGDQNEVRDALMALKERNLLGTVLDRLEAHSEQIDLSAAAPFIAGLFDVSEDLPVDQVGMSFVGPDMHVTRIVHRVLKRERDPARRSALLATVIRSTKGLYLPIMSVAIESHRQNTQAASSEFLLNEDTLPELQGLCVEKIRNAAVGGDLAHHQKLLYILHRWSEWSSADEPKEWIRKQIESREGLMDLIKGSLTPVRTQGLGDRVSQTHLRFDPENLEAFIDLVELEKTLTELDQHIDTDEGKKTIRIALRGLVRKREGKGGSLGLDDDDG